MQFSALLQAIGIDISPKEGVAPLATLETTSIDRDRHVQHQLAPDRFAITDRWGMYREFDPSGNVLHARYCHHMNKRGGCPHMLNFHRCGCACPYMRARSYELAKWLTEQARNGNVRDPPRWHYGLHHKDSQGRLLTRGLPFVEGICVTPTQYRTEINREHERPAKKHQPMTMQDRLTQINAFHPDTLRELEEVRASVKASWLIMSAFW